MNIERDKWDRKLVPTLALVLAVLFLLALALPAVGTGVAGVGGRAPRELQVVTASAQGSTGEDVPLAGAGEWAQASVEISDAPDDAVVSSVRVKYHVADAEPSGLEVQLQAAGGEVSHTLWDRGSGEGAGLAQSSEELSAFEGVPVNGTWTLTVQGGGSAGYIDDFSVVVYYETDMPVLGVDGPGGMPAILQLPEGAVPAAPSSGDDGKACPTCGRGAPVVPQHVPPGATIIKTENFEGTFPSSGWDVFDQSAVTAYWDDAYCDPCGGDWAAWPADGGADRVDPCAGNDYLNDMEAWMVYGPFDLSDADEAGTEFVMWREIERSYDFIFFGVSDDGYNFTGIVWDGTASCTLHNVTYNDWVGDSSVWVAWVFVSDSSVTYAGPWVDDIVIWKKGGPTPTPTMPLATVKIDPPEKTVPGGTSFTVDVAIEEASDLGAFEFELTYDSSCIQTVSPCSDAVTLGPFLGSTGRTVYPVGPTCQTGKVSFGAYSLGASPAGPNGDGVLATVKFRAGTRTCDTNLHLQNVSVTDTAGSSQPVGLEDGLIHVITCPVSSCPEDLNCDGVINIVDIQMVANKYGQRCPTRP